MVFHGFRGSFGGWPPLSGSLLPMKVPFFGLEGAKCSQKSYKIAASERATSGVAIRYFRRAVRLLHASSSCFRARDVPFLPSPEGLKAAGTSANARFAKAEAG